MSTTISAVEVDTVDPKIADPNFQSDTATVSKSGSPNRGDNVTVDADEDANDTGNAVIVLKVVADPGATAAIDRNDADLVNLFATAAGTTTTQYLKVTLNQSDKDNWTVKVGTSGGSSYTFVKGKGGVGHY